MEQTREIHPGMGLRTIYEMLVPEGIGRDAFIALGLREGYRLKSLERQTRTTYSVKSNRYSNLLGGVQFTGINELWSSDITYFFCLNQFFYIVFIMDVYSRRILGYSLADNMRAENNVAALKMALKTRGVSNYNNTLIHHSDKGSQYVSDVYTELLEANGIQISMCNEVYENTHIERVNDTIKNQYLKRMQIGDRQKLHKKLSEVIKTYNEARPHKSLNKKSPVQFENALENIEQKRKNIMTIYTTNTNQKEDFKKQLNLFEPL
jgi:transposase InsO family protein